MFDSPQFNGSLFFPRPDVSRQPEGAVDTFVGDWHVRRHRLVHGAATLLLFHGNGEVVADYDGAAPRFAEAGVNLCVADFPGYGASRGAPTLRRLIEEARAVFDAVKPGFVMGRSLGSACCNALLGEGLDGQWVLESGFVDLRALVRRRGLELPRDFVPEPLFDPLPKLRRARGRLLVLHGAQDALIVPAEARAAHEAAAMSDKRLMLVEGRGHNDLSASPQYWQALSQFFTR